MLDFFDTLIEYVELIWDWFTGFLESGFTFFTTVADTALIPTSLAGHLPDFLGTCVATVTALGVVKAIFGR